MTETRIFTAGAENAGQRLDKFLALQMPEFSRSEIQKFKAQSANGKAPLKHSYKLRANDIIEVEIPKNIPDDCALSFEHCTLDLNILHEDDDIIVINKPRGIVMYPSAGNRDGTLVQNVLAHANLSRLGGATRPGVVHRLDKDTSGVVIFAKSDAAYRELVKTFAAHDLTRSYIAFVWGVPNWESADISGNIARSSRNRQKMTMVRHGGKEAHTQVDVMNVWGGVKVSQLRCTLLTGRTHQIRVHLSAHGFPVLCDPVYGRGSARLGNVKNPELLEFLKTHNGQMLHAEVLELKHPTTGQQLRFKSRLPEDMQELKGILNQS
ncbi:MAG: RluA family pseudouridine synthase [Rickettsiales bacterium]|jgi:23S rRNA pseudouridine1911/1915/1917 synthase|nr:RluA family pseudouridine synthase [Rickettsiales bacterium]